MLYSIMFAQNYEAIKFVNPAGFVIDPVFVLSLLLEGKVKIEHIKDVIPTQVDGPYMQLVYPGWGIIPASPPPAETPE